MTPGCVTTRTGREGHSEKVSKPGSEHVSSADETSHRQAPYSAGGVWQPELPRRSEDRFALGQGPKGNGLDVWGDGEALTARVDDGNSGQPQVIQRVADGRCQARSIGAFALDADQLCATLQNNVNAT